MYLYVAIDRTSKFAFVQLVEKANTVSARAFLDALVAAVPYKIEIILTDNGIQFAWCGFGRRGRRGGRATSPSRLTKCRD